MPSFSARSTPSISICLGSQPHLHHSTTRMIVNDMYPSAMVGLAICGGTDWKLYARKMKIDSVVGSYLDPLADKNSKKQESCYYFQDFEFDSMATRNRTLEFRKHRDAVKSVRAPLSSSASASGGPVIEMVSTSLLRSNNRSSYTPLSTHDPGSASSSDAFTVGLPPSWVDDSEEIATNIQRARVKMSELTKAHAKALMPSFGDGKDDQRQIETLTREITSLLRKSEVKLKKLSAGTGSSEESNVRKNVQRSLATDLQNLSMDLRRKQSAYLKRLQQQQEGYDGVDLEMNFNGSKSGFQDDGFGDMGFSEEQMTKLKKKEHITEEREREIEQVAKSVNELAQIMKDLSVLVIDQGTIVDRIDYNIQSVATSVEEGFKQLQKAERTQKKGGMVTCATVLVIMCFVMLVLLILKEIFF